jgi:hypothetical protein
MPRNPITRREFADHVRAALRQEGATGEFEFDELENTLTQADRPPFRLEEHFLEVREQGAHLLDQLVRAYAHMYIHPPQQPESWEAAKDVIFPYVRPMAFHAHRGFRALQGEAIDLVPFGAVTEHVTVCIGTPTRWKTLAATVVDLKRWGVTLEQALEQAQLNVNKRPKLDWQASPEFPGVYRSPWKDEYGIARMLFQGAYDRVPLVGDPVVIVPTWQTFFVAGSDDKRGLESLARLGRSKLEKDGFLIFRPMRLHGGGLEHWLPPKNHPAYQGLRFLALANECGDYADQATVGRRFFERQEQASNIPLPNVCRMPGSLDFETIATWREGPPCALPKVDYVRLKTKFHERGIAKWPLFESVLGAQLERMGTYPPRWLGKTFPSDAQIAAMDVMHLDQDPGPL